MRALFATCAVLILHCSSGSSSSDGGTDATSPPNDASNNDVATNNMDAGDGGTESSTPPKPYTGFVDLNVTHAMTDTYTAIPVFFVTPDAGATGGCTGTKSGVCCYTPPTDAGVVASAPTPVSAGTVTITDGKATLATFTPMGTTYKAVTDPPTAALTWKGGDTIEATGTGATVLAFSGTVTAATDFAMLMPALSLTTPITIDRAKDLVVTWTAVSGTVILGIDALKNTAEDGSINCSADDTGTMTVPTALLSKFAATDTALVSIQRIINADASNANATITLASTTATNGTAKFE